MKGWEEIKFVLSSTVGIFLFAFLHLAVYFGLIDLEMVIIIVTACVMGMMVEIAYFLSERFRKMINRVFSCCIPLLKSLRRRVQNEDT